MQRISTLTKSANLFGAGKDGFRNGDIASSTAPTDFDAAWCNGVQEELATLIEGAGLVLSGATFAQVYEAVRRLIDAQSGNYVLDTGVANAYVVALDPAIAAYANGMTVRFRIVNTNTGASTLNAGGGVLPLVNDVGGALLAGDAPAGGVATAVYDLVLNKFLMTSLVPSQAMSQTAADARYAAIINGKKPGDIFDFGGTTAPAGSLVCPLAPTNVSVASYRNLCAAIGITWGYGGNAVAGTFIVNNQYVITTIGTTDFTLIGAASNTVGLPFTATGVGAGTGSAALSFGLPNFPADYAGVQANGNVGTQTVGAVIAHSHVIAGGDGTTADTAFLRCTNNATNHSTQSTGGSANYAAGVRVLKCVQY